MGTVKHIRWNSRGSCWRGNATFLEDACQFGSAPILWVEIVDSGGPCTLAMWGVRLGDIQDYEVVNSTHKGYLGAMQTAEQYAASVRKRFLSRKLAELDAERAQLQTQLNLR